MSATLRVGRRIFIYDLISVKLSTGVGRATDRGGVLLYWNDKWNMICSDDFNDTSARVVCRELGFEDGQAQCCSAYGELLQYGHVVTHKVNELDHDKTNKTTCVPSKDLDQPGHQPSLIRVFAVHFMGRLGPSFFRRTAKTDQTGRMARLI